jgi:hypothetical protein
MRIITLSQISGVEDMFDGITDTQTEVADQISETFDVGGKNCVAILNTYGITATLTLAGGTTGEILDEGGFAILDELGGSIEDSGTISMTVSLIRDSVKDWWDYWFAPSRVGRDVIFYFPTQPPSTDAHLTIDYLGGTAKCGLCVTGVARQLMTTRNDIEVGIDDYSRVATDEFGQTFLNPGRWAKRLRTSLLVENDMVDAAYRLIVKNRATPTIFDYNEYSYSLNQNHTSAEGLQPLIVYGFTEDFEPAMPSPAISTATHEVQGLV